MKSAKVLAAVMAGTMVVASAAPVFAATKLGSIKDGWWWEYDSDGDGTNDSKLSDKEVEKTILDTGDLVQDGTYSYTMKCVNIKGDFGEDQVWVVSGDIFDDNDDWVSFGTHGDCWNGGSGKSTNSGQNTSVDFLMKAGDYMTVEIQRAGVDFNIGMFLNGKKKLSFKAAGSNLSGTIHTRVVAQFGNFEVYDTVMGSADDSLAAAKGGSTAKKTETNKEETKTETKTDTSTTTTDAAQTTTDDSASDATTTTNADNGTAATTTTTTTTSTTQTGDEGIILFVAAALAGCAAIAFAAKKRFVK